MKIESESYWQCTAPAMYLSPSLPQTVEVAVVGGGLLGASTCYWLAREGIPTSLFEQNTIAYGATGRNGGIISTGPSMLYTEAITTLGHETARAVMEITSENYALLRLVLQEESIACEYREPGMLRLALTQEDVEKYQREVEALHWDGFPGEFLDRVQVQLLMKTPLSREILGGRFKPEQGLVHSARLVQGLVQAAQRRGVQTYRAAITRLETVGDHVLLHTASQEVIRAHVVVVAANVWTCQLLPDLKDHIMPVREQMLAYAPIAPVFSSGVAATVTTDEYWHQTPDGTILIGGCGSMAPRDDMGVWEMTPTDVVQQAIEQVLPRLFPAFASLLHVIQRWAGLLDFTSDMQPIVDYDPRTAHILFVCGFSGHGMPFGMRFGQLLTEAVKSGILPSELKPFRRDRPTLKKWEFPAW